MNEWLPHAYVFYGCRSLSGKLAGVVPPQIAPAEPTRCATP